MVVAATKNKHLKIVTYLRIGVRNLSSIGKKKKKKLSRLYMFFHFIFTITLCSKELLL